MNLIRRHENEKNVSRSREWDPFALMQEMLHWEPFQELSTMWARERFVPSFEVKETQGSYVFKADLPGVKEEDVDVSLTGNRITISGQRREEKRDENERYYAYERSYGNFSRSFTLPEGVNQDEVHAELREGVLTVTVAKKPEVQPKRISLKRGEGQGEQSQEKRIAH
jgi:HSP20 family protein